MLTCAGLRCSTVCSPLVSLLLHNRGVSDERTGTQSSGSRAIGRAWSGVRHLHAHVYTNVLMMLCVTLYLLYLSCGPVQSNAISPTIAAGSEVVGNHTASNAQQGQQSIFVFA